MDEKGASPPLRDYYGLTRSVQAVCRRSLPHECGGGGGDGYFLSCRYVPAALHGASTSLCSHQAGRRAAR